MTANQRRSRTRCINRALSLAWLGFLLAIAWVAVEAAVYVGPRLF